MTPKRFPWLLISMQEGDPQPTPVTTTASYEVASEWVQRRQPGSRLIAVNVLTAEVLTDDD